MQIDRPQKLIDPVCGMAVEVTAAEAGGRLVEHDGRTYAFCGIGCLRAFVASPEEHIARAEAVTSPTSGHPVIDEGMRRWYESCSCCLSEAYPDIKAALDLERAAASLVSVADGICEVADAGAPSAAPAHSH